MEQWKYTFFTIICLFFLAIPPAYIYSNPGDLLSFWQIENSMNTPRCRSTAVADDNHIYAIGGQATIFLGGYHDSTEKAIINPDGSLGPWTFDRLLPGQRTTHGAILYNEHLYVIGGWDGTSMDSVVVSKIQADGSLGEWTPAPGLVQPMHDLAVARSGNKIYAVSGDTIQQTTINPDGSLEPWSIDPVQLNNHRILPAAMATDTHLYILGGRPDNSSPALNSIERAEINEDGSLQEFVIFDFLTTPRYEFGVVGVDDNKMYAIGGHEGLLLSLGLRTTETAQIFRNGSLGGWSGSRSMVDRRRGVSAVLSGEHIYALGGSVFDGCKKTVERIKVERAPTPTPTLTPTLTPSQPPCSLPNFGDNAGNPLRQTDPKWSDVPYGGTYYTKPDGETVFLPFRFYGNDRDTIGAWGCALTSAAMIVNYFADQQGSDFHTDPVKLNKWLQENEGYTVGPPLPNKITPEYVSGSFVDHNDIIRFSKLVADIEVNFNGIEKKGKSESNEDFINRTRDILNSYMCALNPVILGVNEAKHYVDSSALLSGQNPVTWQIHDPLSINVSNLKQNYNNQYAQLTKYSNDPIQNSLSIAGHSPIEMIITDPTGRRVGFDNRTQEIINQIGNSSYGMEFLGADDGEGGLIDQLLLDIRPAEPGDYLLEVFGMGVGRYDLEISAMTDDLKTSKQLIAGMANSGSIDTYRLNFDPQNGDLVDTVREIQIDIKPGSDENPINCQNKNGIIPIAIISTPTFNALDIDHTSVKFEGAPEAHVDPKNNRSQRHEEDVDSDDDLDLIFHFRLKDTNLTCLSELGTLTGQTHDGLQIEGTDKLTIKQYDNEAI